MPTTDQNGGVEAGQRLARPGVQLLLGRRAGAAVGGLGDLVGQAVPAADPVQAEQGERQQRGHDHEELQHLVVDRRRQPAERDVGEHHDRGHDQGDPEGPAEQRVHDRGRAGRG